MRHALKVARPLASLVRQTLSPKERARGKVSKRVGKNLRAANDAARLTLCMVLVLSGFVFAPPADAQTRNNVAVATPPAAVTPAPPAQGGGTYQPQSAPVRSASSVNVRQTARQEALAPAPEGPAELKAIDAPKGRPDWFENRQLRPPGGGGGGDDTMTLEPAETPLLPPPSGQGSSPGPSKAFRGEFLSGSSIPPDTMGAVGPNHVVTVSNNQMNFRTRNGVIITRLTLNAFWAGVTLEGGITTPSTFDPKIFYDRFNDKYFFFSSANSVSPASSVLFAVTQTNDPTGTWDRYVFDADATATGGPTGTGRWADYPTIGFNKNWIVANYNVFNYSGTATTGYFGPYIYVIPKSDAYDGGTLTTTTLFTDSVANCVSPFNNALGCGFTMAPHVAEDNTSDTLYFVEDWDSNFGQLRVSKLTGTALAPVLTVGTQFPQAPFGWRFNAARIGTTGGYLTQRDQLAYAPSATTRVMANDSRINNAVYRNGSLWTSHHIMVGAVPNAVPATFGVANPDIRTAVQWWEINPAVEAQPDGVTGLGTPPVQRQRIEDPLADNCNSGSSINNSTERAACTKVGQHFAFAGISVNKDNDVLIGFSQFSALTFPSAAYAMRRASDPANTTRDVVVYYPGKSNYNIGAGSGTGRQNRWGDYSASQTDPVNDTDFWTVQEYSGTRLNFGIGTAAPWETAWALVKPNSTQPSNTGNLIISEFRLRGPQGPSDEFVELYNPSTTTPLRVTSVDNSDGWALAWNNGATTTGLTVVPQGTVIAPRGRLLVPNSPVSDASGLTAATTYSLTGYPSETAPGTPPGVVRNADGDVGYSVDVADNAGVALFKSADAAAGFIPANQADAAGFAGAGTLFREGLGIPAITAGAVTGQISFHRNQSSGAPQDTNDNAADFIFTNTLATTETLGGTPLLGAPGPENLNSPRTNLNVFVDRIDTSTGINNAPNRFRDLTPVTNGTQGTISFRRRVTNLTGQTVTRLRFRIRQITTAPAPPGVADLRALTSGDITVNSEPVKGTTVEEPPTQPNGGGWNTSWTVALNTPIAPGGTINVQYVCGVMQPGSFSIFINVEALP